jgi:hypothetical protein
MELAVACWCKALKVSMQSFSNSDYNRYTSGHKARCRGQKLHSKGRDSVH